MRIYNGVNFKKDLLELFPSIYLTLLSMIQGVVFGFLVYNLILIFQNPTNILQFISVIIFFLCSLYYIFLIWYDYLYNNILKRYPNPKDITYPFFFGILQAGLAYNLTRPILWMIFSLGIGFVACFAYENTRKAFMEEVKISKNNISYESIKFDSSLIDYLNKMQFMKIFLIYAMFLSILFVLIINIIFSFLLKDNFFNYIMILIYFILMLSLFYLLTLSFLITERLFKYAQELKENFKIKKLNEKIHFDFFNLEKYLIQWANHKYARLLCKK